MLAEKQTLPMFLGLSQTTKSRKFSTERDKGPIKTANTVNSTLTFITLPSMRLISEDNLRIHWFKRVS